MFSKKHVQRVCNLYKRAVRCLDAKCENRVNYRYNATILRSKFDNNKSLVDSRQILRLLEKGEEELQSAMLITPKIFDYKPSRDIMEQKVPPPDWVLDSWYPIDKSAYPEYFERREQRKKEYVAWWNKHYGKSSKGFLNK